MRTTAALAAGATAFALILTGCGDDKTTTDSTSTPAGASSASNSLPQGVDSVKLGAFVVSFKSAFPKLADGKDDTKIASILSDSCKDIKAGKSEDDVVAEIVKRAGGKIAPSKEEALAIYQMAKMMC